MTLWTLAGFVDVMRCELAEVPAGCALGLRMGDELILAELWPSVEQARACWGAACPAARERLDRSVRLFYDLFQEPVDLIELRLKLRESCS